MREMSDGALVLIAIVIFVGVPIGLAVGLSKYGCDQVAAMSSKETRYDLFSGCYVKVNGQFIPKDNWRGEYEG